ncbi:hypothetical protein QYF61_023073 [Mycteria americana]|uniref:Uncharacterized protein n=1 Tax=Mycteria americana TaxID=33587 RepID=A0AAN7NIN6_MYCAM|nr:hypothetical protein QYF61_023073 [Mycteria americana]
MFYAAGGETLAQVAPRGGRCPVPGNIPGQVGRGSEQPALVEDVPARGRGLDWMAFNERYSRKSSVSGWNMNKPLNPPRRKPSRTRLYWLNSGFYGVLGCFCLQVRRTLVRTQVPRTRLPQACASNCVAPFAPGVCLELRRSINWNRPSLQYGARLRSGVGRRFTSTHKPSQINSPKRDLM